MSKRESEEEGEMERVKQRHDRLSTKKNKNLNPFISLTQE